MDSTNTTDGVSIDLIDNSNTRYPIEVTGANGITINYANGDIEVDGASLDARLDAIEADYLTAGSITNLTLQGVQHDNRITAAKTLADANEAAITALQTAVAALPTTTDVNNRLPLVGGTLTGDLNLNGNVVTGLGQPQQTTDAATKSYVDARETALRNDLVSNASSLFSQLNINNTDLAQAGIDFSGSAIHGDKALKFRTVSPTGTHYATFGTSSTPFEYSWNYGSDETFNYIHNNQRVFAVADKAYATDLVLCAMTANANGPIYNNTIDVRSKLAEIDTLTTRVDSLDVASTATHNIYYGDTAPIASQLQNGDLRFDSDDLRLSVRHAGAWVFPDRVEDTALKAALYDAVDQSTDYESLKVGLMAALI